VGIRVEDTDDHPGDPGSDDGIGAWPGPTDV
jgi:hypothetical protein